jgi:hypothetical protein
MKFTQLEIIEIKKIAIDIEIPMSFRLDGENSIDFDFSNDKSIQSIIRRTDGGYSILYTNPNATNDSFITPDWEQFKSRIRNWLQTIKRENPIVINFKENIKSVSPSFYKIFQEAIMIDELGFNESSGMIFRKALEIIIKDFLKSHLPKKYEEEIIERTIGSIIYYFYQKNGEKLEIKSKQDFKEIHQELFTIISLAKAINNTFKIGNDFSHYERRLEEFTSSDMKNNIYEIIDFIDNQIEKENLKASEAKLNDNFEKEKLI